MSETEIVQVIIAVFSFIATLGSLVVLVFYTQYTKKIMESNEIAAKAANSTVQIASKQQTQNLQLNLFNARLKFYNEFQKLLDIIMLLKIDNPNINTKYAIKEHLTDFENYKMKNEKIVIQSNNEKINDEFSFYAKKHSLTYNHGDLESFYNSAKLKNIISDDVSQLYQQNKQLMNKLAMYELGFAKEVRRNLTSGIFVFDKSLNDVLKYIIDNSEKMFSNAIFTFMAEDFNQKEYYNQVQIILNDGLKNKLESAIKIDLE